jgi:hypothetical protein
MNEDTIIADPDSLAATNLFHTTDTNHVCINASSTPYSCIPATNNGLSDINPSDNDPYDNLDAADTLAANTWGYNFSPTALDPNNPTPATTYFPIPKYGHPLIINESNTKSTNDPTYVTYGVNPNTDISSGTYLNQILYTATALDVPPVPPTPPDPDPNLMSSLTKAQCLGMTEYNGTNLGDI